MIQMEEKNSIYVLYKLMMRFKLMFLFVMSQCRVFQSLFLSYKKKKKKNSWAEVIRQTVDLLDAYKIKCITNHH